MTARSDQSQPWDRLEKSSVYDTKQFGGKAINPTVDKKLNNQ